MNTDETVRIEVMMEQKEQREKIYLSSPTMHGEEQKFVAEAFDTNWVAPLGPNVNNFEKEMAEYTCLLYTSPSPRD